MKQIVENNNLSVSAPAPNAHPPRAASFALLAAAAKLASGFAFRSDSLAESPAKRAQSKRHLIVAWRAYGSVATHFEPSRTYLAELWLAAYRPEVRATPHRRRNL